ncbi:acetyl-CoA carboxylase biotin carboxyl carrier protein subunit [Brevibacillus reuszeri]|uniref:acetyl-CoA carboxylase n=1 Tax=Brevibacillus reuszeri TaxID=54915 RepID=UPI001B0D3A64|nr:acetyl-CoA carboxylase [Brevibacillus reuszeri]GIO08925.1 acetyl-CoA carboxylase biotin carboxyl carrier protein subunit [Brevibacillus reuszeri]
MSEKKVILSPLPGVFYRKPSPDQPDYAREGDTVKSGDIVGLIEVMKNFYEVKVEEDGVIDRFSVENETIVDVDQELVVLK